MTYFIYTSWLKRIADGLVDWDSIDIRVRACMSNTTCDTEKDVANLAAFTTIDPMDGSGYTDHDIASLTNVQDDTNDRAEVQAAAGSFGSGVGVGTRALAGLLYYQRVDGTNANDRPIAWNDQGFPLAPAGGAFDQEFDPQGVFQITTGS